MEKHRARRGLFYGGILLFCGCGLYRPQLLTALLAAVRDIALPPLLGGLLAMLLAAPWKKLSQLLGKRNMRFMALHCSLPPRRGSCWACSPASF